jgi:hypothetical protein
MAGLASEAHARGNVATKQHANKIAIERLRQRTFTVMILERETGDEVQNVCQHLVSGISTWLYGTNAR